MNKYNALKAFCNISHNHPELLLVAAFEGPEFWRADVEQQQTQK